MKTGKMSVGKLVGLIVALVLIGGVQAVGTDAAAPAKGKLIPSGKIGPIAENLYHVQGVAIATDTVFITSVDKVSGSGFLYKIDRKTMKVDKVANFGKSFFIHPSGLQFDGKYVWMAIAMYSEKSKAEVFKVDPVTMKSSGRFKVDDHIGLVVSDGAGKIIGANWDARKFYFWDEKGKVLDVKDNPTSHGYQDCKLYGQTLICSGGGAIDFIDVDKWEVTKTIDAVLVPGGEVTREGMDYHDGVFYFLPTDGAGTYVYIFKEG